MAKIWGTNIDVSAIAGNIKGGPAYWRSRLEGAENPNDVLFEMAYTTPFEGQTLKPGQDVWQGQGQGNPNVGAVQSNTWSLTGDQPSWAEQAVQTPSGRSDIYQDRSDPSNVTAVAGVDYVEPTRESLAFYDGPQGAWTVRDGVTTFEGGDGKTYTVSGPGVFPPGFGPTTTGVINGQPPPRTQRGFLNQPTGRYPVAPMGYPSGVSYPAAQDAAQGWAGEMGFNINPRGGLLLRPWEAASWDLSGIDPQLWDAPFAKSGFLGGPGNWRTDTPFRPDQPGDVTSSVIPHPGVIPNSDKANDLASGRTHHPEMYDQNDMWVGAEGRGVDAQGFETDPSGRRTGGYINDSLGIGNTILGWMGADTAEQQRARAIMADADMDVAGNVGLAMRDKYRGYSGAGTQPNTNWGAGVTPNAIDHLSTYPGQNTMQNLAVTNPAGLLTNQGVEVPGSRVARTTEDARIAADAARNQQRAAAVAQKAAMANSIAAKGLYDPMDDYQDEMARQALTSYSMGPNYGALSGSARLGAGGVSDINAQINAAQKANEIAAARARWAGMDDETQRTMMASAGKPDMNAMLEAMAQQQAAANLSAAGGMEFGGLLGEVDVAGGSGSRGMFGGEVGYGPGR